MNRSHSSANLWRSAAAGLLYFVIVFSFGFLLGVLRIWFVAPAFGELPAVLVELPIILTIAWVVCGRVLSKLAVSDGAADRLMVGVVAFGLLMVAETPVAMAFAGISLDEHLSSYRQTGKVVGLLGQLAYAAFPLVRRRARDQSR